MEPDFEAMLNEAGLACVHDSGHCVYHRILPTLRAAYHAGALAAAEQFNLPPPARCVERECPGCGDCNPIYRLEYVRAKLDSFAERCRCTCNRTT